MKKNLKNYALNMTELNVLNQTLLQKKVLIDIGKMWIFVFFDVE